MIDIHDPVVFLYYLLNALKPDAVIFFVSLYCEYFPVFFFDFSGIWIIRLDHQTAFIIFLALVATLPTLIDQFTNLEVGFGGTSLLIAVGVALDTMKQLENQLVMRNYQGFLK